MRKRMISFKNVTLFLILLLVFLFAVPLCAYAQDLKYQTVSLNDFIYQGGGLNNINDAVIIENSDGSLTVTSSDCINCLDENFTDDVSLTDDAYTDSDTISVSGGDIKVKYVSECVTYNEANVDGVKQAILNGLKNWDTEINVYSYQIPVDNIFSIYCEIINNNPYLFYAQTSMRYSYMDYTYCIYPSYNSQFTKADVEIYNSKKADIINKCIYNKMTDVEKALSLHDYLVSHCCYDLSYTNYDAYSALVTETTVCQGYALAYEDLLNTAGVETIIVTSRSMNHAWNQVKINGNWYHVDATWDDPVMGSSISSPDKYYAGSGRTGNVYHGNFLKSDSAISSSHSGWDGSNTCSSTSYDSNTKWENINSAVIFVNGHSYCIEASAFSYKILKDFDTTIYSGSITWPNSSYYSQCYVYLSYYNNFLYFNDLYNIYAILPSGNDLQEVYSNTEDGLYIYGSLIDEGTSRIYLSVNANCENTTKIIEAPITTPTHTHQEVIDLAQNPTCTQTGLTKGAHCSICGEILTKQEEVPALGHNYVVTAATVSCTEAGYSEGKYCSRCGIIVENPTYIEKLGHNVVDFDKVESTGTTDGYTAGQKCSRCGEILSGHILLPSLETKEKIKESIKLKGYSLTLLGDDSENSDFIGLNFYINIDREYKSYDLKFKLCGLDGENVFNVNDYFVSDEDENVAKLTVYVPAACMTQNISIYLCDAEGNDFACYTQNVKNYCMKVLENEENSTYFGLVKALLNYGAYAQIYFDKNIDDLANSSLADISVYSLSNVDFNELSNSFPANTGLNYLGSSLILSSRVNIRHYFEISDLSNIAFLDEAGQEVSKTYKGDSFYIEFSGIAPTNFDSAYCLKIKKDDVINTFSYSVKNYMAAAVNQNSNEALLNLLGAMYTLSEEAKKL